MSIAPDDIVHWKTWAGRSEMRRERLDREASRRFAAALGENLDVERQQPSLGHWAFFLPVAAASEIDSDGHPKRGGLLPPVSLPRRMFAAADIRVTAPLELDKIACRTSTVIDVTHKAGRTGDLVLVQVEHLIEQDATVCVRERQTIVYRDAGAPTAALVAKEMERGGEDIVWQPRTVDLFRFSAATFNSHRIHYDQPYARDEEGYPGLVVHGPFIAARLFRFAARKGAPSAFSFRAAAPIFAGQPVRLSAAPDGKIVNAIRCDGVTAMSAEVTY